MAAKYLLANNITQNLLHIFNDEGKKLPMDKLLKTNPERWGQALSNEIGRLSQGVGDIKGNNILTFIPYHEVSRNKQVAYTNMI